MQTMLVALLLIRVARTAEIGAENACTISSKNFKNSNFSA
jgi:hypothetical protein